MGSGRRAQGKPLTPPPIDRMSNHLVHRGHRRWTAWPAASLLAVLWAGRGFSQSGASGIADRAHDRSFQGLLFLDHAPHAILTALLLVRVANHPRCPRPRRGTRPPGSGPTSDCGPRAGPSRGHRRATRPTPPIPRVPARDAEQRPGPPQDYAPSETRPADGKCQRQLLTHIVIGNSGSAQDGVPRGTPPEAFVGIWRGVLQSHASSLHTRGHRWPSEPGPSAFSMRVGGPHGCGRRLVHRPERAEWGWSKVAEDLPPQGLDRLVSPVTPMDGRRVAEALRTLMCLMDDSAPPRRQRRHCVPGARRGGGSPASGWGPRVPVSRVTAHAAGRRAPWLRHQAATFGGPAPLAGVGRRVTAGENRESGAGHVTPPVPPGGDRFVLGAIAKGRHARA